MAQDLRSEITDILQLTKMINMDAIETRSKIDQGSQNLKVNVLDPKKVLNEMMQRSGQTQITSNPASYVVPPTPQVQTLDGVMVSAPAALIPFPEGYFQKPEDKNPPPTPTIPMAVPQSEKPKFGPEQLEFDLKSPEGINILAELKEINHGISILNRKLSEILEFESAKYARRTKKSKLGREGLETDSKLPFNTP
jgi:hypothetical protein